MSVICTTTVTDAADSYDLTTLNIIQSELGIIGNTTKLQRYLSSASIAVANYCSRVFQEEGVRDEFRRRSASLHSGHIETLQLSRFPIISITSLTESGTTLVEDVDFIVNYDNGQLTRLSGDTPRHWTVFPVIADYVGGYEDIPSDVQDAVIKTVRARWLGKDRDPAVKEEMVPGLFTTSYATGTGSSAIGTIPPDAMDDLMNYRVPVVA